MNSKIFCDAHMHTDFSTDCSATVRSMLDAAVEKGLGLSVSRIIWIWISRPRREKNIRRAYSRFNLM